MRIDDLIVKLKSFRANHGNVEVFDLNCRPINDADIQLAFGGEYDKTWNMPTQFLMLGSD